MAQAPALESPPTMVPSRVRYTVLAWFCTLSMITYIDRVCIMQVQESMMLDLGLIKADGSFDTETFSWAFAAFALAYAMFEVPTGWLGDKLGPKKVLVRIVLCWLLFTALTGLVTGLIMLVVIRFLFGAGEAGAYPNIARGTRNWFPFSERGKAQGMIWTFGRWGGAVAPILIVALTYPFDALGLQGWRFAFILLGVLGVFWVGGFSTYFKDTPREHPGVNEAELELIEKGASSSQKPAPISWRTILSSRTLWALSFMYFCSNAGWSFFITYVPRYFRELGLSGWQLHVVSGLPLLFGGFGCLLGGYLTDRQVRVWGRRWGRTGQGLVAYFLGASFFLLAGVMTQNYGFLAVALICLASFVKDLAMAASWATTIDIGHRYSGTVAGLMNTVGNLGTVVMAPLVAFLVAELPKEQRWSASLPYYATMFFIASVCWLFINPRRVIVYAPEDERRLRVEGMID